MTLSDSLQAARVIVPRLLSVVAEDTSATVQWRVAWPSKVLSDRGYVADWTLNYMLGGMVPQLATGRWNMMIMTRLHWANSDDAYSWRDLLHNNGIAWLYGADDNVWSADHTYAAMGAADRGEQQAAQDRADRTEEVNRADAVLVSTDYLAGIVRKLTDRPVVAIPNLIDADWFSGRLSDAKRTIPPLTVGWSGTFRPDSEFKGMAEAWHRIAERYPEVTFVMHGSYIPALIDAVPSSRLKVIPWKALADYPRALLNIDIACCSVTANDKFSLSKSPIKWLECTLAGAACVVSNALYGAHVQHGHDGMVATTANEWEEALCTLIESESLRTLLHDNAEKRILSEYALSTQWPKWVNGLSSVLEKLQ